MSQVRQQATFAVSPPSALPKGMDPLQRHALADPLVQRSPAVPQGGGSPLPEGTRARMERAFQTDFSTVRVHEGEHAPQLGAVAFTQGENVHFAPGRYAPESAPGQHLLGHELAHVVQQRSGLVQATGDVAGVPLNDNPGLEAAADAAADAAVQRMSEEEEPTQLAAVQRDLPGDEDEKAEGVL